MKILKDCVKSVKQVFIKVEFLGLFYLCDSFWNMNDWFKILNMTAETNYEDGKNYFILSFIYIHVENIIFCCMEFYVCI